MSDQIIIPGGRDPFGEIANFEIRDRHTVFEWCTIYTDDHPAAACMYFPNREYNDPSLASRQIRLKILGAIGSAQRDAHGKPMGITNDAKAQIRNSLYRELKAALDRGQITPLVPAYCADDPDVFDATRCAIDAASILSIARRRGDAGEYIRALLAEADGDTCGHQTKEVIDESQTKTQPQQTQKRPNGVSDPAWNNFRAALDQDPGFMNRRGGISRAARTVAKHRQMKAATVLRDLQRVLKAFRAVNN